MLRASSYVKRREHISFTENTNAEQNAIKCREATEEGTGLPVRYEAGCLLTSAGPRIGSRAVPSTCTCILGGGAAILSMRRRAMPSKTASGDVRIVDGARQLHPANMRAVRTRSGILEK